jgi:hypothetical protein
VIVPNFPSMFAPLESFLEVCSWNLKDLYVLLRCLW